MSLEVAKELLRELRMTHSIDNIDHLLETALKEEWTCLEFMKRVLVTSQFNRVGFEGFVSR